ncbi:phage head closure protein [Devosia sp. A449]
MRAGKLNHQITLEAPTKTVSPAGTVTQTWAPIATVRAEILQQTATEFLRAEAEAERNTIIFRVRYVPGLTTSARVTHAGQAYDLVEIKPLGRRQGLELRCERLAS